MNDAPEPEPRPPLVADLVVTDAVVVTGEGTLHDPGMLAVRDGRFVHVGPPVPFLAGRVLDAEGGLALPGMVNAHTHLAMTLFRGLADDRDLDGFLARMLPAELAVLSPESVAAGTELAIAECLRAGITAALDMYWYPEAAFEVAERAGFRLHGGPVFMEVDGPDSRPFGPRMRWAERWLASPPAGPGSGRWLCPHGTYLLGGDHLRAIAELSEATGARVHVHAAETRAEVEQVRARHGRTPIEVLADTGLLGPRTVLAHAVHLSDHDVALVAEAGASVAHCPASNLKLASGIARIVDLLAAGVPVALGTDGPAAGNDLDLWLAMRLASYTQKAASGDATVLPAATTLGLATLGGARALGSGDDLGCLEVGRLGDVVVLDASSPALVPTYDPHSTLAFAAARGEVRHVVVGGRIVVADREVLTLDVEAAAAKVRGYHHAITEAVR